VYEEFYGFSEKPFSILPDPSFLYLSKVHNRAITLLRYSLLSGQGFTVLSGEIGSGKTTLVNRLLEDLDEETRVGVLNFTQTGHAEILRWVAMTFGLTYEGKSEATLYDDFLHYLIGQYASGRKVVLIVDEAQNLGIKGLEKLRMLSNVNARKDYLLHMILVGQPELHSLIKAPQLQQLAQRVSVAYHLGPMKPDEAKEYIRHRLEVAGGDRELFEEEALDKVVEASGGVPRVINALCDLALVYGYSGGATRIDRRLMEDVSQDREAMGLSNVDGEPLAVDVSASRQTPGDR